MMLKGTLIYEFYQIMAYWKKTRALTAADRVINEKISYGDHPSQYLVLYSPVMVDPHKPLIIYYHGGGWIFGKPDFFVKKAALFTNLGYQVVMPCYRKVPRYNADHILEDLSLMLDKLHVLATESKIQCIDKIILGGISAGANLAALIYFQSELLKKSKFTQENFSGMFLYAPPLDLSQMKSTPVLYRYAGRQNSNRFNSASPIQHLKGSLPIPILCVHGKLDALVQYNASYSFQTQFEKLHPGYMEYTTLADASHLDTAAWAHTDNAMRKQLVAWLQKISTQ